MDRSFVWIALAVIGVVHVLGQLVLRALKRRRDLAALEVNWGQPLRSDRSHRPSDRWFRKLADHEGAIDDATWVDLDLDRVLAWADRTLTALGAQMLYTWLRRPLVDREPGVPHSRLQLADAVEDAAIRVRLQRILLGLGDRRGWDAATVLVDPGPPPPGPPWMYTVLGLALVPMGAIAALTQHAVPTTAALLLAMGNPVLHMWISRRTAGHLGGVLALRHAVVAAADVFEAAPEALRTPTLRVHVATARRSIKLREGRLGATAAGHLGDMVAEYARAFFLTEVRGYAHSVHAIRSSFESLTRALEFLGEVDAALALAHLRAHGEGLVEPAVVAGGPLLEAEGLRHPLLGDPVANDVRLGPRGLLVTGSNMAGKSTFLRALGVGVVLAQAFGVVPADRLVISPLRVRASMQAHDDLGASVSLYQAELQRVLDLLREAELTPPCLILLDEVFRGTNPTDRLAASGAVLVALAHRNLVVAATHDLRLAEITEGLLDVGHFAERIDEDGVHFDYRLEPGLAGRTNAIALLGRLGYPAAVVEHAQRLAARTREA